MLHVMLDIETLGTGPNAVVTEIAYRPFMFGNLGAQLQFQIGYGRAWNLEVRSQTQKGRKVDHDTIKWWAQTNPEKLSQFFSTSDRKEAQEVAANLNATMRIKAATYGDVYVWARDPDFDGVILSHFLQDFGFQPPWFFTNTRSHRTLMDIAGVKHFAAKNAHDAMADVDAQIRSAIKAIRILRPGVSKLTEVLDDSFECGEGA